MSDIVRLSECIGPAYYDMHYDIQENRHTYYNLKGGRGSLKSSFISIEIVLGIMQDTNANAVCYRYVGDTLRTSIYEQICWAIDKLGVNDYWRCTVSPMVCVYKPTGQTVLFRGLDKAKKSKSIKLRSGYLKYLWFEEYDEYQSAEDIRSVQQSVLRGGDKFVVFKSMNPPRSKSNWANAYMEEHSTREDTYTSSTTYLQAPRNWLGEPFIQEAEWLRETKPKSYEHEYLGMPVGMGTEVFDNVHSIQLTDWDVSQYDKIYYGADWGWYPDPFHFGAMYYNASRQELYIFGEYRTNKAANKDTAEAVKEMFDLNMYDVVTCDSAEPKSISDYRAFGINARGAEKGKDSVRYGIKWLQSLNGIYIDPVRCPHTYNEFVHYEYEVNKDGEVTSNLPDRDNHSIDMVRYATERIWRHKGK